MHYSAPRWWQRAQPSCVTLLEGITYTSFGAFLVWLGPVPPARGRIIHGQAPRWWKHGVEAAGRVSHPGPGRGESRRGLPAPIPLGAGGAAILDTMYWPGPH